MDLEQPNLEWKQWKDQEQIVRVYGIGMIWYRMYVKSLILLDALLLLFSIIPISAHIANGAESVNFVNGQNSTSSLFGTYIDYIITASYTDSTLDYLYVYLAIHGLCLIAHPFIYIYYLNKVKHHELQFEGPCLEEYESKHTYFEDHKNDIQLQHIDMHEKPIVNNPHVLMQVAERRLYIRIARNCVSIICFVLMLAIYALCIFAIQTLMYNHLHSLGSSNFISNVWISLVLSITQSIIDVILLIFAEILRYIEVHQRQEIADKWECIRLLFLRIFSINMFYAIRVYGLSNQQTCSATLLGVQHTLIVVCYFFGDFLADYLWPWLYRSYKRRYGSNRFGRDYETWYEFRLSEQYSTIAYRHIVLTTGSSFIPGLALLGCIGNYIQLKSDQYRVTHLCRIPKRLQGSYRSFIWILGLTTVVDFFIGYPKGVLFLWLNRQSFLTCDNLSTS